MLKKTGKCKGKYYLLLWTVTWSVANIEASIFATDYLKAAFQSISAKGSVYKTFFYEGKHKAGIGITRSEYILSYFVEIGFLCRQTVLIDLVVPF